MQTFNQLGGDIIDFWDLTKGVGAKWGIWDKFKIVLRKDS
jgi:hypothetical protein